MKRYVHAKSLKEGQSLGDFSELIGGPINTGVFVFPESRVPWYGGQMEEDNSNILNFPELETYVAVSYSKNLVNIEGWEKENTAFLVDLGFDSGEEKRPETNTQNGKEVKVIYLNPIYKIQDAISDLREQFFEEGKKDGIQELILAEGEEPSEKGLYFAIENGSLCLKAAVADFDKVFETFETADKLEVFENALDIAREEAEKLE